MSGERRLAACVEAWPEAEEGMYDPRCCRFPKSCSPYPYPEQVAAGNVELEPAAPVVQPADQPAPDTTAGDALREAIAARLWLAQPEYIVSPWDEISGTTREQYRTKADALLSGPLAQLLADAAELRAKVQRVEGLVVELEAWRELFTKSGQTAEADTLKSTLARIRRALNGEKP
jgi:hypothetical protein